MAYLPTFTPSRCQNVERFSETERSSIILMKSLTTRVRGKILKTRKGRDLQYATKKLKQKYDIHAHIHTLRCLNVVLLLPVLPGQHTPIRSIPYPNRYILSSSYLMLFRLIVYLWKHSTLSLWTLCCLTKNKKFIRRHR